MPQSGEYNSGDLIEITALPNENWEFEGWTGAITGTQNPATITINSDVEIAALFAKKNYEITIEVSGEGTVHEKVIEAKSEYYPHGTTIELTAEPQEGWRFIQWELDIQSDDNPLTLVVEEPIHIRAVFKINEYPLTIVTDGEGEVIQEVVQAKTEIYEHGTFIRLTPDPSTGWRFDKWGGDIDGDEYPIIIEMDEEKYIEAYFVKIDYPLTVTISGEGDVEQKIVAAKTEDYPYGTIVELTAKPANGWRFDQWSGDASGSENPETILIDMEKNVEAIFERKEYLLNVSIQGSGSVTEKIINPKSTQYPYQTEVELTAKPDTGWEFARWEGDLDGKENPVVISMDEEKNVTAIFTKLQHSVAVTIEGNGKVERKVVASKTTEHEYGTILELTAIADAGWRFYNWSGDITGDNNPVEFTVDSDKSITATFNRRTYRLEIETEGEGTVSENLVSGKFTNNRYEFESVVELTAVPQSGWTFEHWSGDITGSTNPSSVEIKGTTNVKAHFIQSTGNLRVKTETTGKDENPDGYTVYVDKKSRNIGPNSSYTYQNLSAGMYQVELKGIAQHCSVSSQNPVSVEITPNKTTDILFEATCEAILRDKILFISNRDGSPALYTMNSDGSNISFLRDAGTLTNPSISPLGTEIIVSENDYLQECTETRLIRIGADGSFLSTVTQFGMCTGHLYPSWSTNANKIAYVSLSSYGYADTEIFTMRPDGSDKFRVNDYEIPGSQITGLHWSPVEGMLVYAYQGDLYTISTRGDNLKNITSGKGLNAAQPKWSPDGKKIVFRNTINDKYEIFVINADGTNPVNLTNNPNFNDHQPGWSPDGSHIIFTSNRTGINDIFIMKSDGGSQTNLTNSSGSNDNSADWSRFK